MTGTLGEPLYPCERCGAGRWWPLLLRWLAADPPNLRPVRRFQAHFTRNLIPRLWARVPMHWSFCAREHDRFEILGSEGTSLLCRKGTDLGDALASHETEV